MRRAASGNLEPVISGLALASDVKFSPTGRMFVMAGDLGVFEVVGGTLRLLVSGRYLTSIAIKGDDLYLSSSGYGTIDRVSLLDGSVSPVLRTPNPYGVNFDAVGNMYFIDHVGGKLYAYNFVDPPRVLANITPYGGSSTGFAFNGRLFWSDDNLGNLLWMKPDGTQEVFARGFVGDASPPAIGPGSMAAQGGDAIIVGDGHNVWRISRQPLADGVLQERSMSVSQSKGGNWMITCAVQYSGVDGSHDHRVSLDAVGPGLAFSPLSVDVGPKNRLVVLREGGVEVFRAHLGRDRLRVERTGVLNSNPDTGDIYYCDGRGQDTTSGAYFRATLMQDTVR